MNMHVYNIYFITVPMLLLSLIAMSIYGHSECWVCILNPAHITGKIHCPLFQASLTYLSDMASYFTAFTEKVHIVTMYIVLFALNHTELPLNLLRSVFSKTS